MQTQILERTLLAPRPSGHAGIPPELDDAVAEIALLLFGNERGEDALYLQRLFDRFGIEA